MQEPELDVGGLEESIDDLQEEYQAINTRLAELDQQIQSAADPKEKTRLQNIKDQISTRLNEIDDYFEAENLEAPSGAQPLPEGETGFSTEEEEFFQQGQTEPAVESASRINEPEVTAEMPPGEPEAAEPAVDEGALARHAEIFAKAEEAARREALERDIDIAKTRTWAQREAESAKRLAQTTAKVAKTGAKGTAVTAKGVGILAVSGAGVLGNIARVPKFLIGKTFDITDNLLKMAQDRLGGPMIKFFEKAFAKKENKDKKG